MGTVARATLKRTSLGVQGVTCPGWMKSQNEARTAFDWGKSQSGDMGKESTNTCDC